MASGVALDEAAILSTVLEGILYGFSLFMFLGAIWVLVHEEDKNTANKTRISMAVVFLVLSTIHMIVNILRIDEGLILYRNTFPGGPLAFFEDVSQSTFVIKYAVYILQTLLGNGMVIFRCYVAWQSLWAAVIPSILWWGAVVTSIGSVYGISQATLDATNIFAKQAGRWITGFYALTLATNLLSSGLLAYRIWIVERNVASMRASKNESTMPILCILIDSAALYSAALFAALLCFVNSSNGLYVVLDMIIPIISIVFYVVLIRIAFSRNNFHFSLVKRSASRSTTAAEPSTTAHAYGMRPVQVHVSRYSRTDSTSPYLPGSIEFDWNDPFATLKVERDSVAYTL